MDRIKLAERWAVAFAPAAPLHLESICVPAVQLSDLVTILLLIALEGVLSADNAMVLAVRVLGLPKPQQNKALDRKSVV